MERIATEERFADLRRQSVGFIYNDFSPTASPKSAKSNVLHAASCHHLANASLTYTKYFSEDLDRAIAWLEKNRGEEGPAWHRDECVGGSAAPGSEPARSEPSGAPPGGNDEPFREPAVEVKLITHLEQAGYEVQSRVRVASGVIDLVATRDGRKLVVEAKGEDAGGYGSAQMNFQMAIGQIASRMTDADATYAVGFPDTPDYRRVLRAFRGSRAFTLLALQFFVVDRDGRVDHLDAQALSDWTETD